MDMLNILITIIIALVHDKELLQKYKKIWYINFKINIYSNKLFTNFHDNEMPKNNEYSTCLSVILLDSIVKRDNNYCPEMFLQKCKYAIKKKRIMNTVSEKLELKQSDNAFDDEYDYPF